MILRPPRDDDFDAILDLLEAVETSAYGKPETTADELRTWLTAPTVDVERDIRVGFDDDRLVAYVDIDRVEADPVRWWSDVRVHPDRNVRAYVRELVAWAEERASEGGILRVWVPTALDDLKETLADLGFHRIRSSYRMEIELDDLAQRDPPQGIEIRPLESGQEQVAYDVHQESFADSWEHVPEPYDEWEHWLIKTETFDPSLWFVAWDGDRAAGVSLCRDRNGIGWIGILAVRREFRRRGIARALLQHSFAELLARGYQRAGLGVDAESLTGANRLYESAGMRVARELEFWDKELAARS